MPSSEKQTAPDIIIWIERQTLSDDSEVFNVRFGNVVLHAVNEDSAREMADLIADAVNEHSNEFADVLDAA